MNSEQATIALKQLTGRNNPLNTLKAMIGAQNIGLTSEGAITFKFKMYSKANVFSLFLDEGLDTYTMVFSKIRGYEMKEVKRVDMLYFDDLKRVFEETTGLRLSL